ncbi:MAG: oxidoreductase [Candidatus Omnitrophica bacterium CG11_big_fil_rev_8_21_14_0_20_64_10]|nr:MAG: oxidoreductase [Candidatus Omnitrophica bacterium CG11_big_fil_rev_8_21_14_0_20_64_10]
MGVRRRDPYDLTGRVAVITGGAGLLGRAHAEAIGRAGGRVLLWDADPAALKRATELLQPSIGDRATGMRVNITRPASVERAVREAIRRFKRIDILINNAALTVKGGSGSAADYFAPFERYPLRFWEKALEVNLTGLFLCARAVGSVMRSRRRGVILNIASTAAVAAPDHRIYRGIVNPYTHKPFNTPIAYCATKAGVLGMTRWLATYWAPHGIRVNALSPGGVDDGHSKRFVRNYSRRVPMKRMALRDEYQGAVLFLVSDASSYVTGENLIVDGGLTCW